MKGAGEVWAKSRDSCLKRKEIYKVGLYVGLKWYDIGNETEFNSVYCEQQLFLQQRDNLLALTHQWQIPSLFLRNFHVLLLQNILIYSITGGLL